MWQLLARIVLLAALTALAIWIAEQPGSVRIDWLGYRVETGHPGLLLIPLLALTVVAALLYRVWRGVLALPEDFRLWRRGERLRKGYAALTQGMVAVAAGDAEDASRQARKAREYMSDNPLVLLLAAEAAQIGGDPQAAEQHYRSMLERPEIEFLGLRGLLIQRLQEGNAGAALELAQRAAGLRPKVRWAVRTLFDLQTRRQQWLEAQITLSEGLKNGAFTKDEAERKRAMLLVERGADARAEGRLDDARRSLEGAVRDLPDLSEPVETLAEVLMAQGKPRRAMKLIEERWRMAPTPALGRLYLRAADTARGGLSLGPARRDPLAPARQLKAENPDHWMSHLVLGEAALGVGDVSIAREQLEMALNRRPEAPEICAAMARLEEATGGGPTRVREWLTRATETPRAIHSCGSCGAVYERWVPHCDNCGAFGTVRAVPEPARTIGALPVPTTQSVAGGTTELTTRDTSEPTDAGTP